MDLKFNIGDKIKIKELDREGRVHSIWFTKHGIEFQVRYFYNGEIKEVYFYEDEIE